MDAPYFSRAADGGQVLTLAVEYEVYAADPWVRVIGRFEQRTNAEAVVRQLTRDGVRAHWRTKVLDEIPVPA